MVLGLANGCVCVDGKCLHTLNAAQMLLIRFGFVTAPLSCRICTAACGSHNVFFKFDITVHFEDSDSTFAFSIINNKHPHNPFTE